MASRICCWSSAARIRGRFAPVRAGLLISRGLAEVGIRLGRSLADLAGNRILDQNAIMFQSVAGCTIQLNLGLFVDRHGGSQVQFGERQATLSSHGLARRT